MLINYFDATRLATWLETHNCAIDSAQSDGVVKETTSI